jgi:hypothetical protein
MNHMARVKNGDGSRVGLIVSFEGRNQFMKSGITFERIPFELVWSHTGNSGRIGKVLPTTSSPCIGRRARRRGIVGRLAQTPYKFTAALQSAPRLVPRLSATDRLIPRRRGRFQMRNQLAPGLPDNYLFPPR